ncbi:DUF2182 domain-containing protein [Paraburkholderia kirstenboschensis]|uniref:DUF2182 domain-containing protein n=1 Tax=Paraburkholderia kirstenboschensis TaxID=1245436 RepID=A0ABZ0EJY7_9BURK|nr:DUF2182 domain-containing protein [Paraburkholderia kirstenboschensis]WOD16881.1 DUF2182 domain-containing protein [Paraburkholderia kirstenboschensis]
MNFGGASQCGDFATREFGTRASRSRAIFYGVCALLFALSAAATIVACVSMSTMGDMPMPGDWTMSMMWMPMCGHTWPGIAVSFVGMWVVMMIAMMLPSLAPVLWRYGEALGRAGHARAGLMTLLAGVGYFAVWAALGAALFALGATLAALEMQIPAVSRAVPVVAGVIVLSAGALQLTAWKAHYLRCCRQAAPYRLHALPTRAVAAMQYGVRLGVHCCFCCASLTALLVVSGVMELRAMAAVTVAITLERVAPRGEFIARGFGFVIVGAGLFMIVRAASLV